MLYFTTFARSPRCTNFYKNRFEGIYPGCNHMFTISSQPVTGFWFYEGSNFAISHRKAWSPLTLCLHYSAARDVRGPELAVSILSCLRPGALGHVTRRWHLSPGVLPFTSVTHFLSFIKPGRMNSWDGLVGWPAASSSSTKWSPGLVSRVQDSKTDVLPALLHSC